MAVQGVWQPRDVDSNTRWCKVREVMTWRAHGALLATQSGRGTPGHLAAWSRRRSGLAAQWEDDWQFNGQMTGSSMGR